MVPLKNSLILSLRQDLSQQGHILHCIDEDFSKNPFHKTEEHKVFDAWIEKQNHLFYRVILRAAFHRL